MNRVIVAFAAGIVIGSMLLLFSVSATGGWFEYRWAPGVDIRDPSCLTPQTRADLVAAGWEVVPGQPDRCYVRRPRFFH